MKRAYKYRLYPTRKQEHILLNNLFLCRNLYNTALEQRISAYKSRQIGIPYKEQQNELRSLKAISRNIKAFTAK